MAVCSLSLTAYAHDVPDLTRRGSITITVSKGGTAIPGGSLTIFRVGEVGEEDGNYFFQPTGDFADCGESFEDFSDSASMAKRLLKFAEKEKLSGLSTKTVGEDGSVRFSDLELGLYLVTQKKAASGYAKLEPFLVSLPYMEDGKYQYDLAALPKPDLEREPEPTDPPPTEPDESLPQTGQLWWPVPLLAMGGMALFAAGWMLFVRKGKNHEG